MTDDTTGWAHPLPLDRLREVLAAVLKSAGANAPVDEMMLHDAICAYVRQLRAEGMPPERMLATIKGMASQSGVPDTDHESWTAKRQANQWMQTIVEWSIAEYFRAE